MGENKVTFKTILCNLDLVLASIVLAVLIILTFAGVFYRYVLMAPFTWLEEVQMACMVWIVFAAAGPAFRVGGHVAIEMIVDMMPKPLQKIMDVFISLVIVVVLGYLFDKTLGFINIFLESGRATSMLKIPYWLIYGIAIPALIDMLVSYFYSLYTGVKSEVKEAASSNE